MSNVPIAAAAHLEHLAAENGVPRAAEIPWVRVSASHWTSKAGDVFRLHGGWYAYPNGPVGSVLQHRGPHPTRLRAMRVCAETYVANRKPEAAHA